MKKAASLILTICLALTLCACADNKSDEPDATPTMPAETLDLSIYAKEEGVLSQEVWYNTDGLKFSTVIYEYDGNGRLVKERTLGVNDAPVGYKQYERDENGNVTSMISYVANGPEEYSEEYRTVYEYNESGLKMKETNMVGDSAASTTMYAYEGKNLVSEKLYEGSELVADCSYEYDENGRLVSSSRTDNLEGSTQVTSYTYDDNGCVISVSTSVDGSVTGRTDYTYDDNGNELTRKDYGANGEPVSSVKSEYSYDEPGNIIKCTRTQGDDGQVTVIEYNWMYSKG